MEVGCDNRGHRKRLRERFFQVGIEGFSEHEIVELLLTLCIPQKDVKPLAKRLVSRFGGVKSILDATPSELAKESGVGTIFPFAVKFVRELIELYLKKEVLQTGVTIDNLTKLETFWRARLGGLKYEVFEAAFLNARLEILDNGIVLLEKGLVSRTHVYTRKLMEFAFERHAYALIIAHNHPSGAPNPSINDILVTERIKKATELLDLQFLDHIIVARNETYSFRRSGFFNNSPKKESTPN